MGIALVRIKIMPESPSSNLAGIEEASKSVVEKRGGIGVRLTEEPIAFGLKAVYVSFEWPEEKDLDELEIELGKVREVRSAEVSDIRRAIG